MKIALMRKVDYYAGIPLCFLATLLVRGLGLLARPSASPPRKVLFIELSEMGSAILVDPAMRKIQRLADAELHFLIFKQNAASLRLLGTVPEANVFTIRADNFVNLAWDSLRYLFWARRRGIDTVIDLELFSRYSALLTGLSGAARRVGFYGFNDEGLYRGHMLTHRVAYNPHLHIAKNFISLVNATLAERTELPFSKTRIDDGEIRLARAPGDAAADERMRGLVRKAYPGYDAARHRIVLVNPNASELLPQRRWMPERFAAVMRGLLEEDASLLVLITGAPEEREEAALLQRQVGNERCVNFAGCVRLEELPALYRVAALLLSNDSGPGHFSSVTDLHSFILFGPETPRLYGSLGNSTPIYAGLACSPCVSATNHRKTPCTDNVCLQVITADSVLQQLRRALAEKK
jgi:ADP-heptose:LPS heptosyltransferase